MTISTTTSTITYQGNGATTVFTFPFVADQASDLVVSYTNTNGVVTVLSPSLYTVAINAVPVGGLWGIGGSVTYPLNGGTAIQNGTYITIARNVPLEQTVSIGNQGAFYPQVVEQGLDILEMQIQQISNNDAYALKVPNTDPTPPNTLPSAVARENLYLAFDATGQPICTTAPTTTVVGSSATPRAVSTTGTATISMTTADSFGGISITQSSTPVTSVQLPSSGGPYPIIDQSRNSGTSPITILAPLGGTILGQSTFTLNANGISATFMISKNGLLAYPV